MKLHTLIPSLQGIGERYGDLEVRRGSEDYSEGVEIETLDVIIKDNKLILIIK